MPLRNAIPYRVKPRGVTDSWDATNSIPGAMRSLQNLIPDPSTPNTFHCRPASTVVSTFPGFSSPQVVSHAMALNGYVFGLIGTSRNPGYDEPFVYHIASDTFLTVRGITASNVPATQAATGEWTPPTSAAMGPYVAFTHPGFSGTNGYFGFFDVSGFTTTANGNTSSGSTTVTGAFPLAGLMPGYTVTGSGIPAGTTVVNTANVSGSTTGNTNSSVSLTNVAVYIPVGSTVTGTGIVSATTVTNITGSPGNYTVTMSQAATATASGITIYYSGTTVTLSQAATATANAVSLTIAGGSYSSPLWATGNTLMNPMTGVPTSVQLFYSRLYFAVSNMLFYTDTLSLTRTTAGQALTVGDDTAITAQSLFTLTTTTQGILQGLLAFKANTVFQVTGDAALSSLALNSLNTAAGTVCPRSVVPTPIGVMFVSNDGVRIVLTDGTVSEPDQDLRLPFINALYPSRISASYNADVYRVCTQRNDLPNAPWQEFWFDLSRQIWTGPHTCQQDLAAPYDARFICFSHLYPATMFFSYVLQYSGNSFVEYGSQLVWFFTTSPVGGEAGIYVNTANETTLNIAINTASPPVTATASDESAGVLATGTIYPPALAPSIWGSFFWGLGNWGAVQYGVRPHSISWTNPIVFTKLVFQATALSSDGFKISNVTMLVQTADYLPSI